MSFGSNPFAKKAETSFFPSTAVSSAEPFNTPVSFDPSVPPPPLPNKFSGFGKSENLFAAGGENSLFNIGNISSSAGVKKDDSEKRKSTENVFGADKTYSKNTFESKEPFASHGQGKATFESSHSEQSGKRKRSVQSIFGSNPPKIVAFGSQNENNQNTDVLDSTGKSLFFSDGKKPSSFGTSFSNSKDKPALNVFRSQESSMFGSAPNEKSLFGFSAKPKEENKNIFGSIKPSLFRTQSTLGIPTGAAEKNGQNIFGSNATEASTVTSAFGSKSQNFGGFGTTADSQEKTDGNIFGSSMQSDKRDENKSRNIFESQGGSIFSSGQRNQSGSGDMAPDTNISSNIFGSKEISIFGSDPPANSILSGGALSDKITPAKESSIFGSNTSGMSFFSSGSSTFGSKEETKNIFGKNTQEKSTFGKSEEKEPLFGFSERKSSFSDLGAKTEAKADNIFGTNSIPFSDTVSSVFGKSEIVFSSTSEQTLNKMQDTADSTKALFSAVQKEAPVISEPKNDAPFGCVLPPGVTFGSEPPRGNENTDSMFKLGATKKNPFGAGTANPFKSATDKIGSESSYMFKFKPEASFKAPPKISSSILIIHQLNDDIRTAEWLQDRLSSYGKILKITLVTKRKAAKIYFEKESTAEAIKTAASQIFCDHPEIKVKFGREKEGELKDIMRDVSPEKAKKCGIRMTEINPFDDIYDPTQETATFSSASSDLSKRTIRAKAQPAQQDISLFRKKKKTDVATRTTNNLTVDLNQATKRFNILEQRDKELRDLIVEIRDGAQVGICYDLCPEKERYRRVVQQDISSFEQTNGEADPQKCMKAYSRSAADQEETLPTELRPATVLRDSCWYLCSEICTLDKIYGSGVDHWYDFMWKRTRAIRKDITQQHLSCKITAEVLEIVARYHIWCGHALAKEDRAVFSSKINNENLEKTMTSIEQAYQDLAHKHLSSPAEAEFRAYMIYLNLNDTIRAMQHLKNVPQHLRNSPYIARARLVINSFISLNYSSFFRQVRSATLLEGSVLFRYFNQMRSSAMRKILLSYAPNEKVTITFFTRRLLFDDDSETELFLASHNIFASEEGYYQFKECKQALSDPEEALPTWTSNVIKDKIGNLTPGHMIWGENMKPWTDHTYSPSTSFVGERLTVTARDIVEKVCERLRKKIEAKEELLNPEYQAMIKASEKLISETINSEVAEIATATIMIERTIQKRLQTEGSIVFDKMVDGEIKRICMNEYLCKVNEAEDRKNKQEEEKLKYEELKRAWTAEMIKSTMENLITSACRDMLFNTGGLALKERWIARKRELKEQYISDSVKAIIEKDIRDVLSEIIGEEKSNFVSERAKKIEHILEKRRMRLARIAAWHWLRRIRKKVRKDIPVLGKENVFLKISKIRRSKLVHDNKMLPDELKRIWKEKRDLHILKRIVHPYSPTDLIISLSENALRFDRMRLLCSIYLQYDDSLTDYAERKFGSGFNYRSSYGTFYLEHGTAEPIHKFDRVFKLTTNSEDRSSSHIHVNTKNEYENNFDKHFQNVILEQNHRFYHISMTLTQLMETILIGIINFNINYQNMEGIYLLHGLIAEYARTNSAQNPQIIIDQINSLIYQTISRLQQMEIGAQYPPRLLEDGIKTGDVLTENHINLLQKLVIHDINFNTDDTPENIFIGIKSYLEYSGLVSIPLAIKIKRLFYRRMNEENWTNAASVPWVEVITKIVEYKISKLESAGKLIFSKENILAPFISSSTLIEEVSRLKSLRIEFMEGSNSIINDDRSDGTVEEVEHIDNDRESTKLIEPFDKKCGAISEDHVVEEVTPLKAYFLMVEHTFNEEIEKSKKAHRDAKVMIETLKKDFSRFEEISMLRTVDIEEKKQAPDLKKLKVQIKKAERKKRKIDMIDLMVASNRKRRLQLMKEENFEPIDIDFSFQDAVAFDSDKEPINFDKPCDDLCDRTNEEDIMQGNNMNNEENEVPTYSPRRRNSAQHSHRNSICLSHRSSPLRYPPRVNEEAGMAISDDERVNTRIYENPLNSGTDKRLGEDEARMAISESSENPSTQEHHDLDETPVPTGGTTPDESSATVTSEIPSPQIFTHSLEQDCESEDSDDALVIDEEDHGIKIISRNSDQPNSHLSYSANDDNSDAGSDLNPEANMAPIGLSWVTSKLHSENEDSDSSDDNLDGTVESQEPTLISDSGDSQEVVNNNSEDENNPITIDSESPQVTQDQSRLQNRCAEVDLENNETIITIDSQTKDYRNDVTEKENDREVITLSSSYSENNSTQESLIIDESSNNENENIADNRFFTDLSQLPVLMSLKETDNIQMNAGTFSYDVVELPEMPITDHSGSDDEKNDSDSAPDDSYTISKYDDPTCPNQDILNDMGQSTVVYGSGDNHVEVFNSSGDSEEESSDEYDIYSDSDHISTPRRPVHYSAQPSSNDEVICLDSD